MSLIPIKLLCNRRPKSSSGSGSGSSSSGTTTNSAALPDWFYFNTEENSVHCKYPLVGDSEVSAFGYGSSSGSGGGGGGEIDPSVLENYVTKSELDAAGYLSSADMSSYVTEQELSGMGYVTNSALSQMGYLKQSDVSNMGYITQRDMDDTLSGYVKMSYLNEQFAFTANQITALKNLVGNGEISAFGSGSSSGGGGEGTSVEVVDDLTHNTNSDRYKALSAYQGYVLDKKIDTECDSLQQQIETAVNNSHTHSNKTVLDGITSTQVGKWDNAVEQLESSNFDGRIIELQDRLSEYNDMYWEMNDVVTSHTQYLNSYNTRLNSIEAILAYMQLCEDSNGNAYITFTCPIVSTGEIEAYK